MHGHKHLSIQKHPGRGQWRTFWVVAGEFTHVKWSGHNRVCLSPSVLGFLMWHSHTFPIGQGRCSLLSGGQLSKDGILRTGQFSRLCALGLQASGKNSCLMHSWPLSCLPHKDSSGSHGQFLVYSRYLDRQRLPKNSREGVGEARECSCAGPLFGGCFQQALCAW